MKRADTQTHWNTYKRARTHKSQPEIHISLVQSLYTHRFGRGKINNAKKSIANVTIIVAVVRSLAKVCEKSGNNNNAQKKLLEKLYCK